MKILHIGQLIGGLDIYIRNSIIYSQEHFEYIIVHGKGDKNKPISKNGITIKEYSIDLFRNLNPWKDLKCLIQVIKIIHKEKPDIIHCHSAKGGFIGRISGFITNTKTYYTPHAFSFLSTPNIIKKNIYLFLEKIAKLNSYLLACSDSELALGLQLVKYKYDKALVWSNSVPKPDNIQQTTKISKPYICYIGRPSYQKNTLFLIEVIKEVHKIKPNIIFVLLGVGYHSPDLEKTLKKIKKYQLEDVVIIKPWLNHAETMGYVKNSVIYLSVARYEGLPLSIIEAMSLGKTIIASNVVGNKDCVINGYNGFLLPHDAKLYAEKISILMDNKNLRNTFENNSIQYFEEKFDLIKRIKILENIYRK